MLLLFWKKSHAFHLVHLFYNKCVEHFLSLVEDLSMYFDYYGYGIPQ